MSNPALAALLTPDPAGSGQEIRWGTVTTPPTTSPGQPATCTVHVGGGDIPGVRILRSALPVQAGDQVMLSRNGQDLVVVDVIDSLGVSTVDLLHRDGTVVDYTDTNGDITVTFATQAANYPAPFTTRVGRPLLTQGDVSGDFFADAQGATLTGFKFRVYSTTTHAPATSFGPTRWNFWVPGL